MTAIAPKPSLKSMPGLTKLTVAEYERLVAAGVWGPLDKIELICGEVVAKMAHGPFHARATAKLSTLLIQRLASTYHVQVQLPVRLPESMPEPDIVVCTLSSDRDWDHPNAADVHLVVEVSDSSLTIDSGHKQTQYARSGIPVYWIVNIVVRRIEVYTDPDPDNGYRSQVNFTLGQSVTLCLANSPTVEIAVADILPPLPS